MVPNLTIDKTLVNSQKCEMHDNESRMVIAEGPTLSHRMLLKDEKIFMRILVLWIQEMHLTMRH
ncbi:hypothetical protein CFIMG_007909RA00001 [Ceratocystis fimbriata CBS 114723]|uniref:Uncharacterized protein n=1 Tax=Ceratocystis fimbriata CBS 114723 TaxID=1035309 RepID=A0A2C5WTX5_9PEZI|nr:hypothetical protein CFIMG_007909RA00001 [Ceratocystis fimbriata CBS 114723]